jgi:hypothetical protein
VAANDVGDAPQPTARPPDEAELRTMEMARYFWMDQSLGRADGKAAFLFTGLGVVAASLGAIAYFVPANLHKQLARVALRDAVILTMLAMLATLFAALPSWKTKLNLNSVTEIERAFERSLRVKRWALFVAFGLFLAAVVLVTVAIADSGPII